MLSAFALRFAGIGYGMPAFMRPAMMACFMRR